jgi:hypothetical protein
MTDRAKVDDPAPMRLAVDLANELSFPARVNRVTSSLVHGAPPDLTSHQDDCQNRDQHNVALSREQDG